MNLFGANKKIFANQLEITGGQLLDRVMDQVSLFYRLGLRFGIYTLTITPK